MVEESEEARMLARQEVEIFRADVLYVLSQQDPRRRFDAAAAVLAHLPPTSLGESLDDDGLRVRSDGEKALRAIISATGGEPALISQWTERLRPATRPGVGSPVVLTFPPASASGPASAVAAGTGLNEAAPMATESELRRRAFAGVGLALLVATASLSVASFGRSPDSDASLSPIERPSPTIESSTGFERTKPRPSVGPTIANSDLEQTPHPTARSAETDPNESAITVGPPPQVAAEPVAAQAPATQPAANPPGVPIAAAPAVIVPSAPAPVATAAPSPQRAPTLPAAAPTTAAPTTPAPTTAAPTTAAPTTAAPAAPATTPTVAPAPVAAPPAAAPARPSEAVSTAEPSSAADERRAEREAAREARQAEREARRAARQEERERRQAARQAEREARQAAREEERERRWAERDDHDDDDRGDRGDHDDDDHDDDDRDDRDDHDDDD